MRVHTDWGADGPTFRFVAENGEPIERTRGNMVRFEARFRIADLVADDVHPDLEALAVVLLLRPWANALAFDRGVSEPFARAVHEHLKVDLAPIDTTLEPRSTPADGLPALAFSGGADSFAALTVMPTHTQAVFHRRIDPPAGEIRSIYRDDAAMYAIEQLQTRHGRFVSVVESDFEHLRNAVGFPTDWANAAAAVLLADKRCFDSVSWGVIAESAYGIGHPVFLDWSRRRVPWATAFAAVGLQFGSPVAGVSEVGTARICTGSPWSDLVQSCIRGQPGEPCRSCWKCFRKSTLDAALTGVWPSDADLEHMIRGRDSVKRLSQVPIPHEDVVAFTLARYPGSSRLMRLLRERVRADSSNLSWLKRWYAPSADGVADGHRAWVVAELDARLGRMSEREEQRMRAWDMRARMADPRTQAHADELIRVATEPRPRIRPPMTHEMHRRRRAGRPWRPFIRRVRRIASRGMSSRRLT